MAAKTVAFDMAELAEALGLAVIGLRSDHSVDWCTRAASLVLAEGNALRLEHGKVRAARHEDDHHLQDAFATAQSTRAAAAIPIRFGRIHGQPELFGTLRRAEQGWVMLLADPNRGRPLDKTLWRQWFALTPKECELAACLAQGWTTAQAATWLKMRHGTAGSHLKSIFTKMGISRQPELVQILSLLPIVEDEPGE